MMDYDFSQPVPQGSNGAQDAENCRIAAIADELERICAVHEAQLGDSQADVSRFETEQRVAEQMAKANGYWIPMMDVFDLGVPGPSGNENDTYMAALGFEKTTTEGRYSNNTYEVWDLVPRNVLVDAEGDIFVVDAEMKHKKPQQQFSDIVP